MMEDRPHEDFEQSQERLISRLKAESLSQAQGRYGFRAHLLPHGIMAMQVLQSCALNLTANVSESIMCARLTSNDGG